MTSRGTLLEDKARAKMRLAEELGRLEGVDWVSITDNAGGNPQLGAVAFGKAVVQAGKEVVIHLSCKDLNRNGLESAAWQLASEGFDNLVTLSGDYPASGYSGRAKPVFDTDSVGLLALLSDMNRGLPATAGASATSALGGRRLQSTNFFLGAVTTNFKLLEAEVIPQYLKLEKKIELGAHFIINQVGYDARKCHELRVYLDNRNLSGTHLIGNVYLLKPKVAEVFHGGRVPGVVVSDALFEEVQRQAQSPDKGKAFFLELAARQVAIFRGLGYRGVYLAGVDSADQVSSILGRAASYGEDDWREFAREISYSRPGEFFLYAPVPETGLVDPTRLNPAYEESLRHRKSIGGSSASYAFSKWTHDVVFTPGRTLFTIGEKVYGKSRQGDQGPGVLRAMERAGKSVMFGCKDCGDCSLPDIAFLCPESACAKNERNGPCGGSRDGMCESRDVKCMWVRAYERLKREGSEMTLLDHAPVFQDQSLRGTSSWVNTFLGKDHHRKGPPTDSKPGSKEQGEPTKE